MAGLVPRLSGSFCLNKRTALILLGSEGLATHLDTKGTSAVRHRNSVFHDVLKLLPWASFDKLVGEYGSDALVRRFTTRHQFVALLFGQLSGAASIRDLEAMMESHQGRLYHSGAVALKRSTFADANRLRDPRVFAKLFETMLGQMHRGFRRKMGDAVRLIDSTGLRLSGVGSQWARFSSDVCGAKAHVVYDPDLGRPIYHAVTAANVNDISAARQMPIEVGATYVFDLGYYDYKWWSQLDALDCRIVTRFKANTPLIEAREQPLAPDSAVLSDRIGFLPIRQAKNRRNPMSEPVREIVVLTPTRKRLRLLTNDLDAPAQEIADLYKRRWQIELYFRVMKQTLRITKFLGRSENAVRTQIAVALIAYLLLRALQELCANKVGFLETVRLVRANLMHRKDPTQLRKAQAQPPLDSHQLELTFALS
jgi:hypothetical protein